jgi:hypothetical protein
MGVVNLRRGDDESPPISFRHAWSVQFPADPTKLETPSTYINIDMLYRKTSIQFSPIQGLPRALAQVSTTELDKV